MKFIPAEQIVIADNRQRREFDNDSAKELAASIFKLGLLHAPVIRETKNGVFLVAGERRMRAMFDLWLDGLDFTFDGAVVPKFQVPTITLGELTPFEAEEAELEENIRREDLSWQEQCAAIARLDSLRTRIAESQGKPKPSVAELTQEVAGTVSGGSQTIVRESLIVAKHLNNPEVMGAKTRKEALRVLQKQEKAENFRQLSESVGANFGAGKHSIILGDCIELMSTMDDNQFDVILTDPPYGIDAHLIMTNAGGKQSAEHNYDDTYENWQYVIRPDEWYRVAKTQAHLYCFCDIDRFFELRDLCELAGWWVHRTPIIYHKPDAQRVPWTEHGPRRNHEYVLYAVKGKRTTNYIAPDVFSAKSDNTTGHGAGKPVAAYRDLLARSVRPGDSVFDPCAGSGGVGVASHELQCIFTGIEITPTAHGMAVSRIKELV